MTKQEFLPIFAELYGASEVFDPKREKYDVLRELHWKKFGDRPVEQYRRGVDLYLETAMSRDFPSVAVLRDSIIEAEPPKPIKRHVPKPMTPEEAAEVEKECKAIEKMLRKTAEGMKLE